MNSSNNKKQDNKITVDKYIVQSQKRILVKAISYRIFMFILTLAVTYYFLRDNKIALKYTIFMEFITFLFYYTHEILWNAIKFGYETQKVIEDNDEKVIQVKKDAAGKINGN
jgi:uncharacterized membrane protein